MTFFFFFTVKREECEYEHQIKFNETNNNMMYSCCVVNLNTSRKLALDPDEKIRAWRFLFVEFHRNLYHKENTEPELQLNTQVQTILKLHDWDGLAVYYRDSFSFTLSELENWFFVNNLRPITVCIFFYFLSFLISIVHQCKFSTEFLTHD
jgi:hypothetical protein